MEDKDYHKKMAVQILGGDPDKLNEYETAQSWPDGRNPSEMLARVRSMEQAFAQGGVDVYAAMEKYCRGLAADPHSGQFYAHMADHYQSRVQGQAQEQQQTIAQSDTEILKQQLEVVTKQLEMFSRHFDTMAKLLERQTNMTAALTDKIIHLEGMVKETVKENLELKQTIKDITDGIQQLQEGIRQNYNELPSIIKDNTAIQHMFTDMRGKLERIEDSLYKDKLTQLHNRNYLEKTLSTEKGQWVGMVLDIDKFKSINDTYGHERGDEVLRSVADIVQQTAARTGSEDPGRDLRLFRLGGEEMAVMMRVRGADRSTPEQEAAFVKEVAEKIRVNIQESGLCTVSIGVADRCTTLPAKVADKEIFSLFGDKNLYTAKESGRNKVIMTAELQKDISMVHRVSKMAEQEHTQERGPAYDFGR